MMPIVDRFDSPVGTEAERNSAELPPGNWHASNGYGNYYRLRRGETPAQDVYAYHTGVDLVLWPGGGAHEPIYAVANGVVTFARRVLNSTWGNLIVIEHTLPDESKVYSRYGHVEAMQVKAGDEVRRGQQIAQEGNSFGQFPYHLHFDVSTTRRLLSSPIDWPGLNLERVRADYVDPLVFIREHREVKENELATLEQLQAVRAQAQGVVAALDTLISTNGSTPPTTPMPMYARVEGLNIRSGPGTTYPILRSMHVGDEVIATAINGQWATISAPIAGNVYAPSLSTTRPNL